MEEKKRGAATGGPGFVVLKEVGDGRWRLVGEADRQPGRIARAARTEAIRDVTEGKAKDGEV